MIGMIVGHYRVTRKLGEGGMGAVFEAVHQELGRRVAIKVLRPEFSQNEEMAGRLFNEARAVNIIKHPGIVDISEYGRLPDGALFLIMEYLEGESLARRLKQWGQLLPADALRLAQQIAVSLGAAHDKGIIHRDLKPDNVMLVPDPLSPLLERPKILDFGIAKVVTPQGEGATAQFRTKTGALMGTPIYISPEQARGTSTPDHKSDVYSLGVMLYEMLAGRPPFLADGMGELLAMHMLTQPRSLREINPHLSDGLVQLVERMLDKAPAARPAMAEVAAELLALLPLETGAPTSPDAWKNSAPPRLPTGAISGLPSTLGARGEVNAGRKVLPWAAGLGLFLVLLGGGLVLSRREQGPGPVESPPRLDAEGRAAGLLLDVDSDLLARRWYEAQEKVETVLKLPGISQRVRDTAMAKKQQAEREERAKQVYGQFALAAHDGDYDHALAAYRDIPMASVYRSLARPRYDEIFPGFARAHLRSAEQFRQDGDCLRFRLQVQAVLDVDPDHNAALSKKAEPCQQKAGPKKH